MSIENVTGAAVLASQPAPAEVKDTAAVTPPAAPGSKTDAAPETPKADTPQEEKISAVIREKKKLLAEKKRLEAERAAFAKEREELDKEKGSYQGTRTKAQSNPIEALQDLGWSYKDATEFVLNNQSLTPEQQIKAVQDEFKAYKQEQIDKEKKIKEDADRQAQAKYDQSISEFKEQITEFLDQNLDNYELIHFNDAQNLVFETIEAHYHASKRVMTTKESADLVEKYLETRFDEAQKLKKIQAKSQKPKEEEKAPGQPGPAKTLNNSMTGSAPARNPARSEAERLSRALAALNK